MGFTFEVEVLVSDDDNPIIDALLEYADVEAIMNVECELYHGFEGTQFQPPESSEATFMGAELEDINFYPHNNEDSLKVRFLVTSEMREEIARIARREIEKNWRGDYEGKAWDAYGDHMMDYPDQG